MTPRTLLSTAVSGFVLLGCAYNWPEVAITRDCTGNHCEVTVPVLELDGAGCLPDAVPNTLVVKDRGAITIKWTIELQAANKGYRFADYPGTPGDGIVFPAGAPFKCNIAEMGKQFHCTDQNEGQGPYKYDINLVNGSLRCRRDPYIVNQ